MLSASDFRKLEKLNINDNKADQDTIFLPVVILMFFQSLYVLFYQIFDSTMLKVTRGNKICVSYIDLIVFKTKS